MWVEIQCKVAIKADSFTKAVLKGYKDKANILYVELKEETILGIFLPKECLIFQDCVKEIFASKWENCP